VIWLPAVRYTPSNGGQPGEVAGGHREDKAGADTIDAALDGLGLAANGLAGHSSIT